MMQAHDVQTESNILTLSQSACYYRWNCFSSWHYRRESVLCILSFEVFKYLPGLSDSQLTAAVWVWYARYWTNGFLLGADLCFDGQQRNPHIHRYTHTSPHMQIFKLISLRLHPDCDMYYYIQLYSHVRYSVDIVTEQLPYLILEDRFSTCS